MNKPKLVLSILSILVSFSLLAVTVTAATGNGSTFAYSDLYSTLLPTDSNAGGSWMVINGQTVYIRIAGITEFTVGSTIEVSLGTPYGAVILGTYTVNPITTGDGSGTNGVGFVSAPIDWLVGDLDNDGDVDVEIPYCTTMTVHYRSAAGGPVYVCQGTLSGGVNHLHLMIPEVPLGAVMAGGAMLAAFGAFAGLRERRTH